MAAFGVKGAQQGITCVAALLSGQKHGSSNFSSMNSSYQCNHLPWQSTVAPSIAWSMDDNKRHVKLKAQSGNCPYDGQSLGSDIDFSNPFAPGIHIDLLNRMSVRTPLLETTKAVVADRRKQSLKASQQRTRDFVDGLIQYVSSHNENYKYFITGSKLNANIIMEQCFISSSARDEILSGLERIEKDIGEGKFKWIDNVDVRTNIIEALIEMIGEPAKRLDATISHYVQKFTVLKIWCCDSIDKIITQIKELQLELVLLAIRNDGLVLPCTQTRAKWILLGDLVLSKLEQLERSVSCLLSCKDKMDFAVANALPSGNIDDSKNSLSKDSSGQIYNSMINFGNTIIGDIAYDLSNLEWNLASWLEWDLLTPNDVVTRSRLLMNNSMVDMDMFTAIRSSYSIYSPVEDSSERFFAIYRIIPGVLKAASDFVKSSHFNRENIQNFPPSVFFASGLAGLHKTTKEAQQDQSDVTRQKLLNWLQHLQPS